MAVFNVTDVASLFQTNHTCNLRLFEESDSCVGYKTEAVLASINGHAELSIDQNTRKKIVYALRIEPGLLFDLLRRLEEVPLGLAPRILALIQEQVFYSPWSSKATGALSRLFLTLRGWRMPVFFEGAAPPRKGAKRKRKRGRSH